MISRFGLPAVGGCKRGLAQHFVAQPLVQHEAMKCCRAGLGNAGGRVDVFHRQCVKREYVTTEGFVLAGGMQYALNKMRDNTGGLVADGTKLIPQLAVRSRVQSELPARSVTREH
jgi:hypothetical protein